MRAVAGVRVSAPGGVAGVGTTVAATVRRMAGRTTLVACLLLATPAGAAVSVDALLAQENPEAAAAAVSGYIDTHKDDAHGQHLLGHLRFLEGQYEKATQLLDKAATARPQVASYRNLAELVRATAAATKDFSEQRSAHFSIRFPSQGSDALLVPYALETLERMHAALATDLGWSSKRPIRVELYPDVAHLGRVSSLSPTEIETSGVVGLCKWNRIMIVSPAALARGYPWLDTLAHEYVHFAVSRLSQNRAPVWFQEGIAKLLERRWRSQTPAPLSPVLAQLLDDALKRNRLIPFSRMHPSIAKLPSQEQAALAFAEAQMALLYLHDRHGFSGLRRLLTELTGPEEAGNLEKVIARLEVGHGKAKQFEAGWRRFAQKQLRSLRTLSARLRLPPLAFRSRTQKSSTATAEPLDLPADVPKARKYARIGGLLRTRGRLSAALLEYEKAAQALVRPDPMLENTLARLELEVGQAQEAGQRLGRAIALYPDIGNLYITQAAWALAAKRQGVAEQALLAALRIHPMDPRVHCGLAAVLSHDGPTDEKAATGKGAQGIASERGERQERARQACLALGGSESMLP